MPHYYGEQHQYWLACAKYKNFDRSNNYMPSQKSTLIKVIRLMLYMHLLILFFQLPLRDLIIDSTIWRDIGVMLIPLLGLLLLAKKGGKYKISSLDSLIFAYIFYGLVYFIIDAIATSSFIDAVKYFRNHFLPFFIYFPAKYAFDNSINQKKFIKFVFVIFIIYVSTPIVEILLKAIDFPLSSIPWYHFSFNQGDRFVASGGYINPEDSPILGLLGFPHYTVAAMVCIFALQLPFLLTAKGGKENRHDNSFKLISTSYMSYLYISILIISVMILGVRVHVISTFFIFALSVRYVKQEKKVIAINLLIAITLYFLFNLFFTTTASDIFSQFIGYSISNGEELSISAILSFNDILFIINSPLSNLIFGSGYDVISGVTFDSIANSTGWEIKLIFYTAVYGLIWLILFILICGTAFKYANACIKQFYPNSFQSLYAKGFNLMLIVLLIDASHYMRIMAWPILDFWIICLAILSSIHAKEKAPSVGIK